MKTFSIRALFMSNEEDVFESSEFVDDIAQSRAMESCTVRQLLYCIMEEYSTQMDTVVYFLTFERNGFGAKTKQADVARRRCHRPASNTRPEVR